MASSFLGLYVQREALLLSQKALDITGNNISNINTPGYTRQRLDVCSVANIKGTLGYNTAVTLAGKGSEAVGVAQIRDRLLDEKVRNYSGDLCDSGMKTSTLADVEDVFDAIETDELGASFASIVNQFKESLQSFSVDNADRVEMANIAINNAESLVQAIVNYDSKLTDISQQVLGDTQATVDRVNSIFAEMGNLNKQIKDAYITMGYIESDMGNYHVMNDYGPLELKDEMHSLLDELSQYGNIHVEEENDGTFTVEFANQTVVSGKDYAQMAITKENPEPTELAYEIATTLRDKDEWYDLNVKFDTGGKSQFLVREGNAGDTVNITGKDNKGAYLLDSGSLRGSADVYNGRGIFTETVNDVKTDANGNEISSTDITNPYQGIEYYRDMLNSFVRTMTNEMNEIFDGYGEIFTYENADGNADFRTAANNFRVADDWKDYPELISNPTKNNEFAELDNTYIQKMLGVLNSPQEYGDGRVSDPQQFTPEKFVAHICDNLGSQVEYETGVYNATDIMLTSVETSRSEVMDVSMDEEGINMMNYQKWYNAIARMVTALDEALDKLINGTGRVGL
ncbi:MAG: flagellar hook-associated protein FlgK [Oscillospiraceae bacterium]|nr:flagellar hook-associated protein FlgK [Oscillospiraceae bacterium]